MSAKTISKLVKTPRGRAIIHMAVAFDNINHFKNPHIIFALSGLVRFVKGIG